VSPASALCIHTAASVSPCKTHSTPYAALHVTFEGHLSGLCIGDYSSIRVPLRIPALTFRSHKDENKTKTSSNRALLRPLNNWISVAFYLLSCAAST